LLHAVARVARELRPGSRAAMQLDRHCSSRSCTSLVANDTTDAGATEDRSAREERQLRLALSTEDVEVDFEPVEAARLGQRARLPLHALRGEDAAAVGSRTVEADALQVAAELLDGLDRADALDLDRDPAVVVAAHEVDGADVRRPFAAHEPHALADEVGPGGQLLLQVPLDAVLLQAGVLVERKLEVAEDLGDANLEPVLATAGPLAHDDAARLLLDHGRRGHPVQRLVAARVRVHEHRAVRLEHEQARRLGQERVQAAAVDHLAASNDEAHGRRAYWSSRTSAGDELARSWHSWALTGSGV